jgi:hypothetical protein
LTKSEVLRKYFGPNEHWYAMALRSFIRDFKARHPELNFK